MQFELLNAHLVICEFDLEKSAKKDRAKKNRQSGYNPFSRRIAGTHRRIKSIEKWLIYKENKQWEQNARSDTRVELRVTNGQ